MKHRQTMILNEFTERYPVLAGFDSLISDALDLLRECYDNDGKVLTCGNGGSAADSEHIVGELMKGFLSKRPLSKDECEDFSLYADDPETFASKLQYALPAISLVSQTSLLSAYSNDISPEMIYAQQVFAYGKPGDILIALSTSGNSENIVNAAITAKSRGLSVISLTGEKQSRLSSVSDICFNVPADETFKIQEFHLPIYHVLCALIENEYFD